jgi:hypothetical protein
MKFRDIHNDSFDTQNGEHSVVKERNFFDSQIILSRHMN